jgi:hypothetical protein
MENTIKNLGTLALGAYLNSYALLDAHTNNLGQQKGENKSKDLLNILTKNELR